jgi:tripartite-type tricarboxylate transporter receptor subunit TctC
MFARDRGGFEREHSFVLMHGWANVIEGWALAELGYPGFDVNPWFGLFVPAGTPPAIVRQLNADINAVLKQKDTAEKFAVQGAEVLESTPEQFAATLKSDIVKWEKIVRDSGAKID